MFALIVCSEQTTVSLRTSIMTPFVVLSDCRKGNYSKYKSSERKQDFIPQITLSPLLHYQSHISQWPEAQKKSKKERSVPLWNGISECSKRETSLCKARILRGRKGNVGVHCTPAFIIRTNHIALLVRKHVAPATKIQHERWFLTPKAAKR